jgi:hypothetical protein
VPILSWIYKEITGEDLSLMNVMTLLIAIPTSIFHRLIFGGQFPTATDLSSLGGLDTVLSQTFNISSSSAPAAASNTSTTQPAPSQIVGASTVVRKEAVGSTSTTSQPGISTTQVTVQPSSITDGAAPPPVQDGVTQFSDLTSSFSVSDTAMVSIMLGISGVTSILSFKDIYDQATRGGFSQLDWKVRGKRIITSYGRFMVSKAL